VSPAEERERWIDKIQALLAKAEGTDNEAEAETFTAGAMNLMIKHAVEEAELQGRCQSPMDKIVKRRIHFGGIFARSYRDLMAGVGRALGFKTVFHNTYGKSGLEATWVGFESELDDGEVLLTSLQIQIARLMPKAVKEYEEERGWPMAKQEKYVWRRSFIEMFDLVVCRRLQETRKRVIDEHDKDGSLLPVLANRETLVEQEYAQMFPNLRAARTSSRQYHSGGGGAGGNAGRAADIGTPQVANRKAITG
jgi:hypothetical protein